jgi:membrane-associated phospholipid phosphatase
MRIRTMRSDNSSNLFQRNEEDNRDAPLQDWFLVAAPVALILCCLLYIPVRIFDHQLFSLMNGLHSPVTDHFWLGLTTLPDGCVAGMILGAFLVVNPRVTALGIFLLIVAGIAVQLTKAAIPAPRPAAIMETVHVIGPLLRAGSFPSGHAATATAAGLAVAYYAPSRAAAAAVMGLALLTALSRIFVGAHFPSDVIGGIAISLAIFCLTLILIMPVWEPKIPAQPVFSSRKFRFLYWVELVFTLFVMSVYAQYYADSAPVALGVSAAVLIVLAYGRRSVRHGGAT